MEDTTLISGGRFAGIALLIIFTIVGIFIMLFLPQLAGPIVYKIKQKSFVPVQGTISAITIYESVQTHSEHPTTRGRNTSVIPAYYIRLGVDFVFKERPYSVDIKKFGGNLNHLPTRFRLLNIRPLAWK